jgi:hypothetical protein
VRGRRASARTKGKCEDEGQVRGRRASARMKGKCIAILRLLHCHSALIIRVDDLTKNHANQIHYIRQKFWLSNNIHAYLLSPHLSFIPALILHPCPCSCPCHPALCSIVTLHFAQLSPCTLLNCHPALFSIVIPHLFQLSSRTCCGIWCTKYFKL